MDALLSSPIMLMLAGGLVLVVAGIGIFAAVSRRDTTTERLERFVGGTATATAAGEQGAVQALNKVDEVVSKSERGSRIARDLAQADLKLRVIEFILIKCASSVVGALVGAFLGRADSLAMTFTALIGAIVFFFVPDIYLGRRAKGRVKAFNAQLGDTITMMANALRGGYSFLQTMDMVANEAPVPTAQEFKRVVQEVGLGRTTEDALLNLQRRLPSEDLDLLVTAVNIQHEVGGNLAQILDTIGHTIRERVRIKGEIQTLTAQGRLSGYVITALPILLAVYIQMVNPKYMAPMFTFGFPPKAWCCLPVTSLVMIAIGYWAIMKIVDIEV